MMAIEKKLKKLKIVLKLKNVKWFKKLERHFKDHWNDFWAKSKEEYLKMAEQFARDNNSKYLVKINKYWDSIIKYDKEKNIFISINKNTNEIRTFFKPIDGLDYFNKN
jgi:pyocin large subunit-like protein